VLFQGDKTLENGCNLSPKLLVLGFFLGLKDLFAKYRR
jgi:hypothetical protein